LALAACRADPAPAPPAVPEHATASACEQRRFEGSSFTACRYDRRRDEIALFVGPRSFAALEAELGPRAAALRFAMNAGMYDEQGSPIGLFVAEGEERHPINRRSGPGNFHMLPNGVFAIDRQGRVSITRGDLAARGVPDPRWATQSGPMLVIDGVLHPAIQPNGDSLHIRNGVGVADENIAWFVISDEPVSFGRLARLLRDGLGSRNALYFDGAVSSLWDRPADRRDVRSELGPMVAVFERIAPSPVRERDKRPRGGTGG
jgi:uncharacterized protein YigE (DUF2233 family)